MSQQATLALSDLYEADETAWLDAMAELIHEGRLSDLDYPHLAEYLGDMARRDRREVRSRLVVLIAHVLKWVHQPDQRSRSWRGTIIAQQQELQDDAGGGVLRNHAEAILSEAYAKAVTRAAAETGLPTDTFPPECPYSLDRLLSADLTAD